MGSPAWFDLAPDHEVLELDERLTAPGPALELHIVVDVEAGETFAWWMTDRGRMIGVADVGRASRFRPTARGSCRWTSEHGPVRIGVRLQAQACA